MCQVSGATQFIRQAHHQQLIPTRSDPSTHTYTHIFSSDNCLSSREKFPKFQVREMNLIFSAINQATEARKF
jgi:hypothetical protein